MNDFKKIGGYAALIHSMAYIVGIGMYLTFLSPILDAEPKQYLSLLSEYKSVMYVWIFIAYWISGFCLILVTLSIYDQTKLNYPPVSQMNAVLGLIWAGLIIASGNLMLQNFDLIALQFSESSDTAEAMWLTLSAVETGIISSNEFIGGLWVLTLSWVGLKAGLLSKRLNLFGLLIGTAGILSMIPMLAELATTIFALSMIIWFLWLGLVFLRD